MCDFCILFDFSSYTTKVDQGVASLVKAPENLPFLPRQQFNFCPVCGSPRDPVSLTTSNLFGKNLRKIRRARGMTQEQLGQIIGVQKSAVSKYEKGRVKPDISRLLELCRILDVTPQELL